MLSCVLAILAHYCGFTWCFSNSLDCSLPVPRHMCDGSNGSLIRYVKFRCAHAPGMPWTFSPRPTSNETTSYRSRHSSRHLWDEHAAMHVGIVNRGGGENVPGIPGACSTRNITYLVKKYHTIRYHACSMTPHIVDKVSLWLTVLCNTKHHSSKHEHGLKTVSVLFPKTHYNVHPSDSDVGEIPPSIGHGGAR